MSEDTKKKFSILMPPPNVTGSLHMGHALTFCVQAFWINLFKSFGYEVNMLPGLDHGGISTEVSAKKKMNIPTNISPEEKFNLINSFAKDSYSTIKDQMIRLSLPADWDKERYTFDEDHSKLVEDSFLYLYKEGYIYRGKKLVNWDTSLNTVVSDLEVIYKTESSPLYYIPYESPLGNIMVATCRPETIFADVALAVNPEDERYSKYIGSYAIVPMIGRKIPIIKDKGVIKDFATGILKITPAHDKLDYDIAKRHGLEIINIINQKGQIDLSELKEEEREKVNFLDGKDTLKVRGIVVDTLKANYEYISHNIPYSEKGGGTIEVLMSEQWMLKMKEGAKKALSYLDSKMKIFPSHWKAPYEKWLDPNTLEDWCISRQNIWGHKNPLNPTEVLDTWFSSSLWPLTMKKSTNIYPTSLLVTAYDILFFWVARMVIISSLVSPLFSSEGCPFENVYIHGLVRDEEGKKMSKTLGNVINLDSFIEKYGLDVLYYSSLSSINPYGSIRISEKVAEVGRNLITKVSNMNKFIFSRSLSEELKSNLINSYFLYKSLNLIKEIEEEMKSFALHNIFQKIIEYLYFICDWLLEINKVDRSTDYSLKICHKLSLSLLKTFIVEKLRDITVEDITLIKEEISLYLSKQEKLKEDINKMENFIKCTHILRRYKKIGGKTHVMENDLTHLFKKFGIESSTSSNYTIEGFPCLITDLPQENISKSLNKLKEEINKIEKYISEIDKEKIPYEVIKEKEDRLNSLREEKNKLSLLMKSL